MGFGTPPGGGEAASLNVALEAAIFTGGGTSWTTFRTTEIPATAKKVAVWCGVNSYYVGRTGWVRALYNGVEKCSCSGPEGGYCCCHWVGDGLGYAADLVLQRKETQDGGQPVQLTSGAYYLA